MVHFHRSSLDFPLLPSLANLKSLRVAFRWRLNPPEHLPERNRSRYTRDVFTGHDFSVFHYRQIPPSHPITHRAPSRTFINSRGFTFIEAVAVAAILAILSAIAIPTYLSYIKNQRRAGVFAIAQTASSVAHLYWRKTGNNPHEDSVAAQVFLPGGDYRIQVQSPNVIVTQGTGDDTVKATVAFRPGS